MTGFGRTLRKLWSSVAGPEKPPAPEVVVFDQAAKAPHDLDDPFYDDKVQSRIGDVIAGTGNRKTKNTY